MTRVLAQPDLKALFLETLVECGRLAQELPTTAVPTDNKGWLVTEVDRQSTMTRSAVQTDTTKPWTNDQFEAAVGFTREFAAERPDFVRAQVAASR